MLAYVASQQMAERGDLWPYSTRATEARGGRYKRFMRRVVCRRKRSVGGSKRAVKNRKTGKVSFVKQAYHSCVSKQLLRQGAAQEVNAHLSSGRSRLKTTGRKTLTRTLPKWEDEGERPLPTMGNLLDCDSLRAMLIVAVDFFESAVQFPTRIPITALRRAAHCGQ